MKTISLNLIFKDELPEIKAIVDKNKDIFDKIYLTNANRGKDVYNVAKNLLKAEAKVELNHFEWTNDFAEARNFNFAGVKEDFSVWMDADDEVDFSKIRLLVDKMEEEKLDMLFLPYNYAQDEYGNCIALHWRERILRNSVDYRWVGTVHETVIANQDVTQARNDEIVYIHRNPPEKAVESSKRNHEILLKSWEETGDPRYAHYLGLSFFARKDFPTAIKYYREHMLRSGWDEESYRSMLGVSDSYFMMNEYEKAVDSALMATKIMEDYPEAYLKLGQIYFEQKEYRKALSWLKVGISKPAPETNSIVNPSDYGYRATILLAWCQFYLGKFDKAYKLLREALEEAPEAPMAKNYIDLFAEEYKRYKTVLAIKELDTHINDKNFSQALYEALPSDYKHDLRLYPLKAKAVEPKVWPDKSIAFFCGQTSEPWGPDTLEGGMGGSEEAIVYLTPELVKLGYTVEVFNSRTDSMEYKGVVYRPWYEFDYRDTYDTLVVWRMPRLMKGLKAKRRIIDLHDVLTPQIVAEADGFVDQFFVKTDYHRSLYPDVTDDKFTVIRNGIDPSQFKPSEKKIYDVGYFSAPNRGLETLLKLWPRIKEQVPEAKGIWHYGWQSYLGIEGETPEYHRIKKLLSEAVDFEEGGRVDHKTLAKVMGQTKVWGYPTEFPEIHCITALKAQQSGMWPVSTNVSALQETIQDGVKLDTNIIYSDTKMQDKFVEAVVEAIKNPRTPKPMVGVSWKEVAQQWHNAIQSLA